MKPSRITRRAPFPCQLIRFLKPERVICIVPWNFSQGPSFKCHVPSGCSAFGQCPWKFRLACAETEMSTQTLNTPYFFWQEIAEKMKQQGACLAVIQTTAQRSPKEDNRQASIKPLDPSGHGPLVTSESSSPHGKRKRIWHVACSVLNWCPTACVLL